MTDAGHDGSIDKLSADQNGIGVGRGNYIYTYTGKHFYIEDPQPEDIDIVDIAHALSMLCRFGGHSREFYCVAQHSVLISQLVSDENALWGLLHDASEAYLCDIPRPFKAYLENYKMLEERIQRAIADKFGLSWPMPEEIHNIDQKIVVNEALLLWKESPFWTTKHESVPHLALALPCWNPAFAKQEFLNQFRICTCAPGSWKPRPV